MIGWKTSEEKELMLYYAELLQDHRTLEIIRRDEIKDKLEALHVAEFFWRMVEESNKSHYKNDPAQCEYLLEKVINTLMAYFRRSGFESEWEAFADL